MNFKYLSILLLVFLLLQSNGFCQERKLYCFTNINSLVESGDFEQAKNNILSHDSLTSENKYNLAICYSEIEEYPVAQKYILDFIDEMPYKFTPGIFLDYRINNLRSSKCWESIYNKLIEKFLFENNAIQDTSLAISIMLHGINDQKYRGLIASQPVIKKGKNAGAVKMTENVDSINTIFLDSVINRVGWPTYSMVGEISGDYIFFIMQHSDKKHIKKYLQLMEEAVKIGEADKFLWAKAYDRLRIYSNKKQVYGTQYRSFIIDGKQQAHELLPTKNRKNVNQRRKEFGFTTTVEEKIEYFNKTIGIK